MNTWRIPNKKFVPTPVLSTKSINTNYSMQESFPSGSVVKNLSAVEETWVRFLSWEDPIEERMFTHSNILAWRIPWVEEPGRLQSMMWQRVGQTKVIERMCTACRKQKPWHYLWPTLSLTTSVSSILMYPVCHQIVFVLRYNSYSSHRPRHFHRCLSPGWLQSPHNRPSSFHLCFHRPPSQ